MILQQVQIGVLTCQFFSVIIKSFHNYDSIHTEVLQTFVKLTNLVTNFAKFTQFTNLNVTSFVINFVVHHPQICVLIQTTIITQKNSDWSFKMTNFQFFVLSFCYIITTQFTSMILYFANCCKITRLWITSHSRSP